ncbi:MAG: hypothetical protein ACKO2G_00330 [Verrucomicrobiales bacterium]
MANPTENGRRALVVVGLIASAAFFLLAFLIKSGLGRSRSAGASPVLAHSSGPPATAAEREKLAREMAEKVLAAKGWKQWLPLVKDPTRVEPMMRTHHEVQGHGLFPEGTSLLRMADSGLTDRWAWYGLYRLPDGELSPTAFVWSEGGFRFDWESWSAHGSIVWREWLELKPDREHELRVYVESGGERPGLLLPSVPSSWKRVALVHRDSPESADAWLAGEPAASEISELMAGNRRVPVTLIVRWEKVGDQEVAEIQRLVHPGWSR